MASLMDTVGTALIEGMVSNMNPVNGVIVQNLQQTTKRLTIDNEVYKDTILDDLYTRLEKESAKPADRQNAELLGSLTRRIKRIEAI